MGNRSEYYLQADFCKNMASRVASAEGRERWLDLAAKWLALAGETHGDGVVESFTAASERTRSKP